MDSVFCPEAHVCKDQDEVDNTSHNECLGFVSSFLPHVPLDINSTACIISKFPSHSLCTIFIQLFKIVLTGRQGSGQHHGLCLDSHSTPLPLGERAEVV